MHKIAISRNSSKMFLFDAILFLNTTTETIKPKIENCKLITTKNNYFVIMNNSFSNIVVYQTKISCTKGIVKVTL